MMRPYEAMFILRPQLEDEQVEAIVKKVDESITRNGGEILRSEKKGKKRLAYEVKDQRDGHYVLLNFKLEPEHLPDLERIFRLNEDVIRHLILRQEEVGPVLPKPMAPPPAPQAVAAPQPVAAPVVSAPVVADQGDQADPTDPGDETVAEQAVPDPVEA